ncbi:hypothetical protein CK203_116569 [Vitis vinifera]|uniref:Uncharacterized protein n=1 Tax=Vitis vinifera TaxID=29760 RepID=A0A438CPV7_VITVI|nr:hypothetical protein CK203_116569 [Vitis vinifera]
MLEPQTLEGGQKSQANLTEQTKQSEDRRNEVFIVKRLKDLRGLLGSFDKPSDACSLALSGAINMSHTSQYFCTYTPCPSSRKIMVANGSLATVARLEDVYVTPSLILKNVLHTSVREGRSDLLRKGMGFTIFKHQVLQIKS